ncbi:hypothetical protein HMPREF0063_10797 [Aeromicrobium marinum DSM 15272]|uniref:DUF3099 domain-containing protein n=1 Tax=Aeromicrobium marinum DSM 15272 TaxID=585531 RepID=E2SA07_9ACTN|nr:DUF3099 domain-containing protein [Aeromicrobium marinum]EFQ84081.1 hypothetical protein HMPREF0063_10797 [Aeromicrobium marinum DSM 15272]
MKPTPVRREQVALITNAPEPASAEQGSREKRYAISMAIRTICFVGAVVTEGWLRWTLVVGAVVLPYVSVVLANAGVRRTTGKGDSFVPMEATPIEAPAPRDAL